MTAEAEVSDLAELFVCPDCGSQTRGEEVSPGVVHVRVFHDPTCPTLARIEAGDGDE